jgi:hypothetical protein
MNVLYEELSKSKTVPIMAITYMLISFICILGFTTKGFQLLLGTNEFLLRELFAKHRLDVDHPKFYIDIMRIFIILVFIAFVCNFFKSFVTLISLEYGKLPVGKTIKGLLSRCPNILKICLFAIITALHIVIAMLFVLVEQELSGNIGDLAKKFFNDNIFAWFHLPSVTTSSIAAPFTNKFHNLGKFAIGLYTALLIWLFFIWIFGKKEFSKKWLLPTIVQFVCGILIGVILWKLTDFYAKVNETGNMRSEIVDFQFYFGLMLVVPAVALISMCVSEYAAYCRIQKLKEEPS